MKAPKKEKKELDDDDIAFREKVKAGMVSSPFPELRSTVGTVALIPRLIDATDAKANKAMAEKAKGKGPLNAGQQGIKKSGKK